jgi:hypothetical protein
MLDFLLLLDQQRRAGYSVAKELDCPGTPLALAGLTRWRPVV